MMAGNLIEKTALRKLRNGEERIKTKQLTIATFSKQFVVWNGTDRLSYLCRVREGSTMDGLEMELKK